MIVKKRIEKFLKEHHQDHLIKQLNSLNEEEKKILVRQIEKLMQFSLDSFEERTARVDVNPLLNCLRPSYNDYQLGKKQINENKVACVIFAGGMGSRFNYFLPKGFYPISLVENKSLFQILCESIGSYEKKYQTNIPLLILHSCKDKKQIKHFFKEYNFFGLLKNQIFFLEQNEFPVLDENAKWMLMPDNTLALSPDGNGGIFSIFQNTRILEQLEQKKVSFLHFLPIDNPLSDPLDPCLCGSLINNKADAVIKVFKRDSINENIGIVCRKNNKIIVQDYTCISPSLIDATNDKGDLLFPYANIGHYCIRLKSLKNVLKKNNFSLLNHWIWKKIYNNTFGWKKEKFFFDIFYYFNKTVALEFQKKYSFAPLKKKEDINIAKQALLKRDMLFYEVLHKIPTSKKVLELSAEEILEARELIWSKNKYFTL